MQRLRTVFCVLFAGLCLVARAYETWRDPSTGILWRYTLEGDSAFVGTGEYYGEHAVSTELGGIVIIPTQMAGHPVVGIRDWAFVGHSKIEGLLIPPNVLSIGYGAFEKCTGVRTVSVPPCVYRLSVTFPDAYASITNVELSGKAMRIRASAFEGCKALQTVTIPNGVECVEARAFAGCSSLKEAILPVSVTNVGENAFLSCGRICSVAVPKCVTKISETFPNASGITNVVVHYGFSKVADGAFSGLKGLRSVSLPEGIVEIGSCAFAGCEQLTSIGIPESVRTIGREAFGLCKRLRSISVPLGVAAIQDEVFYACSELREVELPQSVMEIGNNAFWHCGSLSSLTIPSGVRHVGRDAFSSCTSLESVCISGCPTIAVSAFWGCSNISHVVLDALPHIDYGEWNLDDDGRWRSASIGCNQGCTMCRNVYGEDEISFHWRIMGERGDCLRWYIDGLEQDSVGPDVGDVEVDNILPHNGTKVAVSPGRHVVKWHYSRGSKGSAKLTAAWVWDISCVDTIAGLFAESCPELRHVELGPSVRILPDSYFQGCESLVRVKLPETLEVVGRRAFRGCSGLSYINIPASVTNIGHSAFEGCTGLRSVETVLEDVCLGDRFPDSYRSMTNLVLRGGMDHVDGAMLARCQALRSLTIGEGITGLGDALFRDCENLVSVFVASSVVDFGDNDFRKFKLQGGGAGLCVENGTCFGYLGDPPKSLVIPVGVKRIAPYAFSRLLNLEQVSFPETLDSVGVSAFEECTALKEIVLSDNVALVDDRAFRNCTLASGLVLPTNIVAIGEYAFANCSSLERLECGAGLREIGTGAFSNCWHMASVSLPMGLGRVERHAFQDCTGVRVVKMPTHVMSVSGLFPDAYRRIESVSIWPEETEMVSGIFQGCVALRELDMPLGVVSIPDNAFSGCFSLPQFALADRLVSIGRHAFYGLDWWEDVDLPASVKSIGAGAFGGWTRVRSVSMPGGNWTLSSVFPDCYEQIETFVLKAGAPETSPSLCSGCVSLTHVALPESVTNIASRTFSGCRALRMLALPPRLTTLSDGAFENCVELHELTFPDSLRRLGARVFAGCSRLAYVRYLGDAPVVDPSAYADAPILLMSQVIYGTRGWDGVATSMALPARWPSSNPHILLRWAPERPKVKFCGNGGIPDAVVLEQVTGLGYVLPADDPEHPHGNFSGWWSEPVGGMPIAEATCVTQTYDHAVYAHWDFEMRTIKVVGPFSSGVTNVVEGDTVTLSTPQSVRDGWTNYVCIGWIGAGDVPATGTNSQVTVEIGQASSIAWLYETNYWVCATASEGGAVVGGDDGCTSYADGRWVPAGTRIGLTAQANEHWHFVKWNDECLALMRDEIIMAAKTLHATFARDVYVISYDQTRGSVNVNPTSYVAEESVVFSSLTNVPGWRFVGWVPSSIVRGSVGDKTVLAQWQPIAAGRYAVTFSAGKDALSAGEDQEWSSGQIYQLPPCSLLPPPNRRFAGWACSNGRRYDDGMLVFDLAQPGETVTMTAIWENK